MGETTGLNEDALSLDLLHYGCSFVVCGAGGARRVSPASVRMRIDGGPWEDLRAVTVEHRERRTGSVSFECSGVMVPRPQPNREARWITGAILAAVGIVVPPDDGRQRGMSAHAAVLPVVETDGRWVLHRPGGRTEVWQ